MRIGTRASALALVQARYVARRLGEDLVEAEIVEIATSGDRGESMSDKSRWTSEIELALLAGRIDVAVHSCKDVPVDDLKPNATALLIPPREDARDVICGAASLQALPAGARVGTASLRRRAQINALRPDLQVVELRGNVDTRLRKLAEGQADAIVLAYAGLKRLGRESEVGGFLDAFVPAPGQGALGLQVRAEDSLVREAVGRLADEASMSCVFAERDLAQGLEASCNTPLGAHATTAGANDKVTITGWVGLPDGSEWISHTATGHWDVVGFDLAGTMISAGARSILDRAEEAAK